MNAFSVILILLGCVFPVLAFIASIIFITYYSTPDDSKQAWLPRGVVIIAFTLALVSVILLPLDIANDRFEAGMNFGLGILWQIFYSIVCIYVIVIIPFAMFYYESEDPDHGPKYQLRRALIQTAVLTAIVLVIVLATYWLLGTARIPYQAHWSEQWNDDRDRARAGGEESVCHNCVTDDDMSLNVFVSIFVFVIAIVSVFGRIVFVVCGGFGLTSLPISLIKAFIDKPKRIRSDEFLKRKALITSRSEKLLEVGRKLMESHEKGVADRSDKRTYKDFQQATYQLENDWKTLHKSYFDAGGSIIFPFISLICGISLLGLTLLWILHIILYMVAPSPYGPISPFLNSLFMILDSATSEFPMIGALFYTVMTFYLLACVLAGAALLARILPFITVHPLVYRDTMMSSILFNVGLFLFSSVTVNQFATEAFAGYARSTALDTMFGSVIRYLTGIYWVYFLSIYLILAFALVGLVLTGLCWRRKKTEFDNILSSGRLDYDDLTHDAPSPPADPE